MSENTKNKRKVTRRESDVLAKIPQPSLTDLERLLNSDEEETIVILPNGEIRPLGAEEVAEMQKRRKAFKPLTMRENLGGEYAA